MDAASALNIMAGWAKTMACGGGVMCIVVFAAVLRLIFSELKRSKS